MDNVRVLLANRPRMLRESLRLMLESQGDIDVATAAPDPVELLAAVDRTDAEVVLVTLPESGGDPGICSHLLAQYPELLVIALSPVEQRAVAFRRVITREELVPLAEENLLRTIRRQRLGKQRPSGQAGDRRESTPRGTFPGETS